MAKLNLNRRELLKLGATIPLMAHLPGTSHAMGKTGLGAMELTILSDGNLQLPLGFAFPDVPQPELEAVPTQSGQSTSM